jgi:hypothetical protein
MINGILRAQGASINTPLPPSWLGRTDAPATTPPWSSIQQLNSTQIRNLVAQIGYDMSTWDYQLVGTSNQLGRYQFNSQILENYGILALGSNAKYGNSCVNYKICWKSVPRRNAYAQYNFNFSNIYGFLASSTAQDVLAYQLIIDTYNALLDNGAIIATDTTDVVAGMIYVGWVLGPGTNNTAGAYLWRNSGVGNGVNAYNSGRYAALIL